MNAWMDLQYMHETLVMVAQDGLAFTAPVISINVHLISRKSREPRASACPAHHC